MMPSPVSVVTTAPTRPAVAYRPTNRHTQLTPYTAERALIGTPAEVAATLDLIRRSGRLIAATRPRPMPEGDPRICVHVRFLVTPVRSARQVTADRRRTVLRAAARVGAVAVPVTAFAAAVVYTLSRVVAEVIRLLPALAATAIAVLIVWAVLGRAGVCCPGIHCPGCSHH
jgi:hypothetical protein